MRVVYLCADPGIPLLGTKGASVHLRSLAAALAGRGNEVTLVCRRLDGEDTPPSAVRVERLPPVEEEQAEWMRTLLGGTTADVVLERYSLDSGPGLQAARCLGVRYVLEVNAPLVEEAARYRGLSDTAARLQRERSLIASSDRVIAVSSGIRAHALASGAAAGRVRVIPNGVDLALFRRAGRERVRAGLGLAGKTVVGFAGSLKPWHGVLDLVAAFACLTGPVHLLLVGDGPEREAVATASARLGLQGRVTLTGAVPHTCVPDYLAAMDVGVAPYLPQERFYFSPLKVAEYMAAGLPVVASDQGDLAATLGQAGLVVPAGDTARLIGALRQLVGDEPARRRLGRAARARAVGLSWNRVAWRVEKALGRGGRAE
jgi:glycosyltransferase involved in cell wall biosynthesis